MAVMLNKKPRTTYTPRAVNAMGLRGQAMGRAYQVPKPPKVPKQPAISPALRNQMWALNPSGTTTLGWNASQGADFARQMAAIPGMGGGSFLGGQEPSYAGLIGGDWEVQDAEAAMAARMASLRSDFQTGLRQGLIDLGVTDTSKLGAFSGYIDADTIAKAAQNKYSTTAQVAAAEKRQQRQSRAALAARGILSSGQTTKSEGDIASTAETARYNALRDFLAQGQSGLRGIADEEYALSRGVAQARQAAAMRAAELYSLQQSAGGYYEDPYMTGLIQMPQITAQAPTRPGLVPKAPQRKAPPKRFVYQPWKGAGGTRRPF